MEKAKGRIHYLDWLRILATIAVIVIHVSSQKAYGMAQIGSAPWQGFNFWDSLSRCSVPLFAIISGALFLNPNYHFQLKRLFTNSFLLVLCLATIIFIVSGLVMALVQQIPWFNKHIM